MRNSNLNLAFKAMVLFCFIVLSTSGVKAQLTGTKNIPGDYATLDLAITDLNAQGVGPGGVILNLLPGNPQTAPAGGYSITASGTLADQITFVGNGNIITASNALTAGALNDAIFKIVGGDYITIGSFDMQENAANTTTAAGTNNMTEWGVVLTYATTTNNAQNISLIGNTITLNRTYQNTWGIYANATHTLAAITVTASGTGATGGNSGLKIQSNIISNVNQAIAVVGPITAADYNTGIDIGGSGFGNTITNYGTTGTFSGYTNISGTVNGILVRNSKNFNIEYNTITSSVGGTTSGTLRGIFVPAFSVGPTGTFTNNINNNTVSVQSASAGGAIEAISVAGTSATTTSSLNINNNNFLNSGHTVAGTAAITFISTASPAFVANINNNTFTNLSVNTTGSVTFIAHTYTMPAAGTTNINGNAIVTAFSKTGAGGVVTFTITNGASPNGSFANYLNNTFSNITLTGATTLTGFNNTDGSGTSPNKVMTGNTFSNLTGGTNAITGISLGYVGGVSNVSGNTFSSITGQGAITGITIGSSFNGANPLTIANNTFNGLSSTGTGGVVTAITCANTSPVVRINNNTINTLSSTGTSLVNGISVTGATNTSVFANKIYGLSTSSAAGSVYAIQVTSGTSVSVYNNVIGNLTASIGNGSDVIRGISVSSSATSSVIGVYDNSIYLNAISSGTNFGTTGIFHAANATATTAALDLRNNIVINESTPNGTGVITAFRRSGAALNNYAATSNRNLFYAGTPSATRTIMFDGTTPYPTLLAYQAVAAPRDLNSLTGEAFTYSTPGSFFISLTGSSIDFLRPVVGITTQVESGGSNIATPSITTDYANVIRAGNVGYTGTGTAPDLGAFEFEGISPAPVITLNSVTPPATTQCVTASRLVSVNITTTSGTITGANLVYAINGTPQTPIAMTNPSGTTWEATIPASVPVNATITWGVTATNSIGLNNSYTGTPYADEPLFGTTGTATASVTTVCSGSPSSLTAKLTKAGSIQLGTATTTTSTDAITPFTSNWEGARRQYLIRASELQALGLIAGNINSMAFIVTATGAGTFAQSNYVIKMGHTSATAMASAYVTPTGPFTTVFTAATEPAPAVGTRTYNFGTPFNWDGVSNVLIDICHDNDIANSCASCFSGNSTVQYSVTPFNSVWGSYNDNVQSCGLQAANTTSTFNNRPNMIFGGTLGTPITSVTWMDGVTTVGTGNPLAVNPTTTTTYTANITALGCVANPAPTVTVTVNPLPTDPTAANSAQCGTQVPTASVTSTTGLPTPTFIWYNAAVAGSVMQTSTSTTYTSNVATTTTFYVSELNTVTGCESGRTPVTITVASADGVSASTSAATICVGGSVTLTAANTNPTPNQSYSYSWSGIANSGAATPVAGSPAVITPTQAGTYTYNLAAVDGLCNAVATVNVTVDPFTSVVTPINVSCNGINNGSFAQGAVSCGTAASYSVNGGSFGPIPTNLIAGTYSIVTMNSAGFTSAPQNITIATNVAPTVSISGPVAPVCPGTPVSLTASSSNDPNYTYTWDNGLGSGATVSASPMVNTTYTVTGTDMSGGANNDCIATATFTVTMNPVPVATASASDNLICNGDAITLTSGPSSTPVPIITQNFDAGLGTWTTAYSGTAPATTAWIIQNSPYTIDGSMDFTNFTTPQGGKFAMSNADLGSSGLRTRATLTSPTFSTVGMTGASLTFQNLYQRWASGDSAVAVQVSINGGSTWTNLKEYFALGTDQGTITNNAQVMVNENITLGAGLMNQANVKIRFNYVSSWGYYWLIDNVQLIGTPAPLTYAWTSSPAGYTSASQNPVAPVSPAVTTTYTMTATNAFGCSASASTTVTVNQPSASTTPITACGSYTWTNGTTYTTSGTHTQTLVNSVGCDSIATLNLTINNPTSSTVTEVACVTYTWAENGTTYTTSGSYPVVLAGANANGCDSTVTLNLTINNPTSSTLTVSACTSYTWAENGTTYTTSGSYPVVLAGANANGCDSTVTLVLTINQPTSSSVTVSACTSYTWAENGTTYTTSGSYPVVLAGANANGCDSTVTLVLTINQPTSSSVTVTTCGSYTWAENGTTYTTSGSYPVVLAGGNANGCDSTVTLILTINQPTSSSVTEVACGSYTWAENGTTYTTSGSYPVVLAGANANGCDSTVTLVLTINQPTSSTVTATACESYTWTENGTTYTTSGSYPVVLAGANANGCDSTVTLVLTITGLPTATATDNGDATITASAGTSYQWINCATNTAIGGATSQTYTATANGDYAVVVTNAGGCSDTSSCVNIDYIGLTEITDASIQVFPNPTNSDVTITMTAAEATVEVVDAQGKLLQAVTVGNGEKVNLSTYETGVYFLRIRTVNGSTLERVVKQ